MWNQRYSEPGFAYGTEPNDFLAATAERYLPRNGEILCLAEGEGRNAVFLARLGFRVTGVDSSEVGLDKARKLAKQHGVDIRTVVADLGDYDLGVERWVRIPLDSDSRSGGPGQIGAQRRVDRSERSDGVGQLGLMSSGG